MEKITEKQTEVETALSEISGCPMPQLDPRVLEVYRGVREVRPPLSLREAVPALLGTGFSQWTHSLHSTAHGRVPESQSPEHRAPDEPGTALRSWDGAFSAEMLREGTGFSWL